MPLHITILAHIPLIREGLRALLADERDFRVMPLAPSDDWFDELLADKPEILLIDVQVLEREGWDVLNPLRRALPALTILILSDSAQDRRVAHALSLGARGYILRDATVTEMANAIRAAHSGILVLHPALAAPLIETAKQAEETARENPDEGGVELIEPLSARELDVLRLMARGKANKQIAAELVITEHTVKFHIRAILGKLGAANRTEAVTLALQKGLVSL
jgi:DNA-binding NarL/FixJ family response regulator